MANNDYYSSVLAEIREKIKLTIIQIKENNLSDELVLRNYQINLNRYREAVIEGTSGIETFYIRKEAYKHIAAGRGYAT